MLVNGKMECLREMECSTSQIGSFSKEHSKTVLLKEKETFTTYKATADIKDRLEMVQPTELVSFITAIVSTFFKANGKALLRKAEPLNLNRAPLSR